LLRVYSLVRGLTSELSLTALNIAVGTATSLFLIDYTNRLQRDERLPPISRLLTHRATLKLGSFSYSLYLIHYPLLAAFYLALFPFGLSPAHTFLALIAFFVPAVLFAADLFHRCFERPFLRNAPADKAVVVQ
jgi:peptidoglycan/LPS O-acetylase OafA/YrhL